MYFRTLLLLTLLFVTSLTFAKDSVFQSGDWEEPTTWVKGIEPLIEDTLVIESGFIVDILTNISYDTPLVLKIRGTLRFLGKLTLPSGSKIILSGGTIETASGNGNSDKIIIGTTHIWSGNDLTFTGDFTLSEEFGVLPVTWGNFVLSAKDTEITLSWSTMTETNNDKFIVETSTGLETWNEVRTLQGSGTSASINNYKVNFYSNVTGMLYIRIKQIDYNGDFDYSQIQTIRLPYHADHTTTNVLYYIDGGSHLKFKQPTGFSIAIYKNGEKRKVFLK